MTINNLLTGLRKTKAFKDWQAKNKDANLVHVFIMLESDADMKCDVGFYDFRKDVMTSFTIDENLKDIQSRQDTEVFKQEDQKIKPLEEAKIKVDFRDACKSCRDLQKEKYKQHIPIKEIVILQNLDIGQVWNITYVTTTFQTLNMKVDTESGKILEDKLHEIFSMGK